MRNIATSKTKNDFTFIVGDRRYDCPWFVADFLSPRIGRLHGSDPAFRELAIGTANPGGDFGDFVSLGRGPGVSLTSVNRSFFISIAAELENYELYWLIRDDFEEDLPFSSFCGEFEKSTLFESASDRVISFIASHFIEIDQLFLIRHLPIATLERVLSHDELRIESEDSLYDFVISVLEVCADSVSLMAQIRFEYLGINAITRFILWSFDHFEEVRESFSIWKALTVRLSLAVSPATCNPRLQLAPGPSDIFDFAPWFS
jgi:hypothetical protein